MSELFERPYCATCAARLESVFSDVSEGTLTNVATAKACNLYKKGDVIFKKGDSPLGLFCIHRGKVKIYKTGDEGRDQIVRFAKNGDVLGYRALVSGDPYDLSAAAIEDSVICCVPRETVLQTLSLDGNFSLAVIDFLSTQLRNAEEQIVTLAQHSVRARLVEALLLLKEVYGTENGDNSPINVTLSRDELASVVGTATETLVRTLSSLKREKLIATEKKKIRILDIEGLIRAGDLHD